jgi:hypothetical protein
MTPFGFDSEFYHCLLDEQPHYLVPERLLIPEDPSGELIVNPNCWFSWLGPLPPDKAARLAVCERLHPCDWMVWVDDPATGIIWPFWVGAEFASCFHGLTPGEPLDRELPENVRWVLWQARVLVRPNYVAHRRREWLDDLERYTPAAARGYVTVPNLIHPFHLGALRRYYRARTRAGAFEMGDAQVAQRYCAHNEDVARFFHYQFSTAVSDVVRTVVKPSYAYSISYQNGSELPPHTDREQCEYSITLCFDATPEPEAQSPWPLQFDTADGRLKVWQYIGDSLLYRGRYLPHSREQLPYGHTSSSLLFHFVDESFAGPLW